METKRKKINLDKNDFPKYQDPSYAGSSSTVFKTEENAVNLPAAVNNITDVQWEYYKIMAAELHDTLLDINRNFLHIKIKSDFRKTINDASDFYLFLNDLIENRDPSVERYRSDLQFYIDSTNTIAESLKNKIITNKTQNKSVVKRILLIFLLIQITSFFLIFINSVYYSYCPLSVFVILLLIILSILIILIILIIKLFKK